MRSLILISSMFLVAVLVGLSAFSALADENDLSNGVFIAHYPPDIQFSILPPAEGWCQHYIDNFAIECCSEQNVRIDVSSGSVWYVLSAWDEEKTWCGTQFGFEWYDPMIFRFIDWGPCFPNDGLEIHSGEWPGPLAGTAFVIAGDPYVPWSGNFVPVYHFVGYAYPSGVIPLSIDPTPGIPFGGWCNCTMPAPEQFEATCFGGMGIFTDGIECCPQGAPPSPAENITWGGIKRLYR